MGAGGAVRLADRRWREHQSGESWRGGYLLGQEQRELVSRHNERKADEWGISDAEWTDDAEERGKREMR